MNGQLDFNPRPSGRGQASYLSGCGKELAALYLRGESPAFEEGVLQKKKSVNYPAPLLSLETLEDMRL